MLTYLAELATSGEMLVRTGLIILAMLGWFATGGPWAFGHSTESTLRPSQSDPGT